ncbi:MAG: hypothetical protein R3B49_09390 [Phycisphaerales bacterium]
MVSFIAADPPESEKTFCTEPLPKERCPTTIAWSLPWWAAAWMAPEVISLADADPR